MRPDRLPAPSNKPRIPLSSKSNPCYAAGAASSKFSRKNAIPGLGASLEAVISRSAQATMAKAAGDLGYAVTNGRSCTARFKYGSVESRQGKKFLHLSAYLQPTIISQKHFYPDAEIDLINKDIKLL